jgi:hypothetical protein
MSEWMAISQWQDCANLARPGIVFEIRNADNQVLVTRCVQPLPAMPQNWESPPVQFRAIAEPKPEHSPPLPAPHN